MRVLTRTNRTKAFGLFAAALAAAGLVPLTAGAADAAPPARPAEAGSCPAAGTVTQWWHSGHDGVDIANNRGTPIHSTGSGTATEPSPSTATCTSGSSP
ncbi:hypothetical protein [Streptomyces sp. NPDC002566]|uniref:hypothetical protein n=1 Tax=Streptomyces sp. NPDC002566 TaxID=3364650 RepID=UPI0036BA66B5